VSSLSDLQSCFVADLFHLDKATPVYIRDNGLPAASRLEIYRNNVFSNYREALRAVYPVVERLVGAEFFKHAADHYIPAYPSNSGDLNTYGAQFADFLANFPPAQSLPYLHDVAHLEWLIDQVFHAAGHQPLDVSRLQTIAAEQFGEIRFKLHPACRLFSSPYPVARIWQVNQPTWEGDQEVDLRQAGESILVHRREFSVVLHPLAQGEFVMLSQLASHGMVADAYQAAQMVQADFDLQDFLQHHIAIATLVDIDL